MKTTRICLGCGMPLPPDAPGGLCPQCLLKSDAPTSAGPHGAREDRVRPVPIPGSTFGGYRIIRLLGQGGMGEVYEAEHIADGRRVALKVMSHELGSEQDRKRFLREGRLAASVNHPNVVYVFGSEEIDGVPVIAMELVAGGTLRDQLKSQPFLPISGAVEAALQIIDGLESANAAGVLHRDIKPANCFVNPDGGVKVGDFGLSVSTLARGESLLTAKGSVLGTPAYTSPEQLRGEELDVRSDIYSVGATLYHLLTGDTPFAAQDFVKLITEVLDKNPPAPQAVRSEIPGELSRVVLRCLAKDRKERFQTYAELRDALLPFRAADVTPADPARRFLAGLIDDTIAYGPCILFSIYWSTDPLGYFVRERTITSALLFLVFYGAYACYYAFGEGLFGAALGKTLCGLRVVGPDRQLPGVRRALIRVGIYMSTFVVPSLALLGVAALKGFRPEMIRTGESLIEWLWIPLWLALFVTMRRSNGYAALHDLVTGTRVIIRPRTEPRPALGVPALPQATEERQESFGPYGIRGVLWKNGAEQLLLGVDTTLNRNVWIHVQPGGAALPSARRELSRPARLRWLTGGTHESERWDAYKATNGQPLPELPGKAISWSAVRFWLLDLAEELAAGINQPPTAAPFALDRIWISSSGRTLLLDFPSRPGSKVEPAMVRDVAEMQHRLQEVVDATLGRKSDEGTTSFAAEVPVHAQSFLANLQKGTFEKPEFIVGNLHSLITKPAEVGRAARAASLILLPAVLLILTVFLALLVNFERVRFERAWEKQYPGKPSLYTASGLHELTRELRKEARATDKDVKLVRVYIAHHFASAITNEAFWSNPEFAMIFADNDRGKLREVVADYSSPANSDLEEAERVVPPKMREQRRVERLTPVWILLGFAFTLAVLFAAVGLVSLFFRTVPTLNLFGIAVVVRYGRAASRGRLLIRWAAVWIPSIILLGVVAALIAMAASLGTPYQEIPVESHSFVRALTFTVTPLALLVWLSFLAYAALHPKRGLQDKLAGTWLVPK